jgi:hypothetical protein
VCAVGVLLATLYTDTVTYFSSTHTRYYVSTLFAWCQAAYTWPVVSARWLWTENPGGCTLSCTYRYPGRRLGQLSTLRFRTDVACGKQVKFKEVHHKMLAPRGIEPLTLFQPVYPAANSTIPDGLMTPKVL